MKVYSVALPILLLSGAAALSSLMGLKGRTSREVAIVGLRLCALELRHDMESHSGELVITPIDYSGMPLAAPEVLWSAQRPIGWSSHVSWAGREERWSLISGTTPGGGVVFDCWVAQPEGITTLRVGGARLDYEGQEMELSFSLASPAVFYHGDDLHLVAAATMEREVVWLGSLQKVIAHEVTPEFKSSSGGIVEALLLAYGSDPRVATSDRDSFIGIRAASDGNQQQQDAHLQIYRSVTNSGDWVHDGQLSGRILVSASYEMVVANGNLYVVTTEEARAGSELEDLSIYRVSLTGGEWSRIEGPPLRIPKGEPFWLLSSSNGRVAELFLPADERALRRVAF